MVLPVPGVVVPWVRERGSGATLGRNRTFTTGKTGSGLPCAWILYHILSFSRTQGFAPAWYPLHCAMISTASLTCCVVVAGPKVSVVYLTVPIRT